jgi:hypothetical protein
MADKLPEWARDMTRVVDDKLVKDLVADFRNYKPGPSGGSGPATVVPAGAGKVVTGSDVVASAGTGWSDAPQIKNWKPPGLEIMDRMVDQQDALDRAQRIREVAEASAVQRALVEAERKEKESQT